MKIRDELLISYIFLILLFLFVSFFYTYTVISGILWRSAKASETAANKIIDKNLSISQEVLINYAERIVELEAEDVADSLSVILEGIDKKQIKKISGNERFRKIVLKNIRTYDGSVAGYIDLLDNEGNSILHPNKQVEGFNYKEWKDEYPDMWKMVEKSFTEAKVKGYYVFINQKNEKKKKYMVLVQVKGTPYIVSASVDIEEFFLPVNNKIRKTLGETVAEVKQLTEGMEAETVNHIKFAELIGGLILLSVGVFTAVFLSGTISRPINKLRDAVQLLGKGEFSTTVPEGGSREIVELSQSFNKLGRELTSYVDKLKEETAARQSLESEIKIGRKIQQTMLPHNFSSGEKFNVKAVLEPAKEVSGDFYDMFFIKENTLALLIGDVSGKGIPASIFMALTATALKNNCKRILDKPSTVFRETNRFLDDYEEAGMFITAFLAYYNVDTGELTYANAGHNKAILLKPDGTTELFGSFGNLALGAFPDFEYKEETITLKDGERLILYTDGVTEATSKENEEYGMERLTCLLSKNASKSCDELAKIVLDSLGEFQGENQFDDITFMVLERTERGNG